VTRFHGLDACRAAAMLLGLFFHGAISFMATSVPWAIQDRSTHPAVDAFVGICHTFRMPVFFLLAGFFGRLVYEKLGPAGFLRHRAKRLLVPFLVAIVPLMASIYVLWRWGASVSGPRTINTLGMETPSLELDKLRPSAGHLWFLYYLMMLSALGVALVGLSRKLPLDRLKRGLDGIVAGLVRYRIAPLILALPTAVTLLFMQTLSADTPIDLVPQLRILAYYLVFAGFGWVLHRQPDLIVQLGRGLGVPLLIAAAALYPLGKLMERVVQGGTFASPGEKAGALYLSALFGWCLVILFIGLFVKWAAQPRPWIAWLSDASYWCYIIHLPLVLAFQIVVANWTLPGPLKYALVMTATIAICLGTYQLFVRHTAIGRTLNGPRERPVPAPVNP
jgi:peptidoglycan/LPS O-acetylase OafA/YrhL